MTIARPRPTIESMTHGLIAATSTSWPDAAIAIAGVALVGAVAVVVVWQALATWRARIAVAREHAYQRLAEQTASDLRALNRRLEEGER
jgi:hypothetical protein